jgi:hypothetical protein
MLKSFSLNLRSLLTLVASVLILNGRRTVAGRYIPKPLCGEGRSCGRSSWRTMPISSLGER